MASKNYIPGPDAAFHTWFETFVTNFNTVATSLGFTASEVTALNNSLTNWQSTYADHVISTNAARSATEAKVSSRESAEDRIRKYVKRIQAHQNTTNAIRASLGITVPKGSKTHPQIPAVAPNIELDWSQRGQVTLYFGTSPGKNKNNPFAEFATAVTIQYRFANQEWRQLATTNRKQYLHVLNNSEPVTIQYRVAYLNAKHQQGPWSETDFALVTPVQVQLTVAEDAA